VLPQKDHPGAQVFRQSCFSCHSEADAKGKGGGLALFRGELLADMNGELGVRVRDALYDGTMPKNGKLTDQQVGEAMAYLKAIRK
jgi:mono/diheme cytochrome c family protein